MPAFFFSKPSICFPEQLLELINRNVILSLRTGKIFLYLSHYRFLIRNLAGYS